MAREPDGAAPGTPYRVPDLELASRLSFFLWSSIPDDELLDLAEAGTLHRPEVLEAQTRRMLADPRADALVESFAGQWLYLRNVRALTPDEDLFPDFGEALRRSFQRETELFFASVLREDRSVLDFLTADYTFVNERLARHYGMRNVYGSHFRRVSLPDSSRRGLLGQGSILAATAYPTRTSPVLRGKWVLENLLGTPPPLPPPDVPSLEETTSDGAAVSMREAMEQHRSNPVCASCHRLMDPPGFALEQFDAVGRYRTPQRGQRPDRRVGGAAGRHRLRGRVGAARRAAGPPRPLRHHPDREAADLCARPGGGAPRRAGHPRHHARGRRRRTPFLVAHPGCRQEPAVPDEENPVMMIRKLSLPRRTFLRGLGATVALPLLDAMVPALTAEARTAARPVRRLGFIYIPNGAVMQEWTPAETGPGFALSRILQPLEPYRNQLTVVSGLAHGQAEPLGDGNGEHSRASSTWLNGVHPKQTEGSDVRAGTTADQLAAQHIGRDTPLPSLELAIDLDGLVGNCEKRLQLRLPETPSRGARRRRRCPWRTTRGSCSSGLFGDGGTTEQRVAEMRRDRSILDSVTDDLANLERSIGAGDRARLDQYLDSIRALERRITLSEAQSADAELPALARPVGIPDDFEDHVRLMYDLVSLAWQADITRVFTFMLGRELGGRTYPHLGVPDPHHGLSHHRNDPEKLDKLARINTYHVGLFTHLLESLRKAPDGAGLGARPLDGDVRRRARRQQRPCALRPARDRGRRRLRAPEGRAAPALPERHAGEQPARQHARQGRSVGRELRRRDGAHQGAGGYLMSMRMHPSAVAAYLVAAACLAATPASARVEAPLIDAVRAGDVAEVRALLAGAADPDRASSDGTTPLHWAANRDDLDSARLLLEAGARPGVANRYGATPLLVAATNGSAEMLDVLLSAGADPNVGLPEGETPLMRAARAGGAGGVRALLRHGAEVDAAERWRGQTALMWAAIEGNAAAVLELIAGGADVHARSAGGFTPLLFLGPATTGGTCSGCSGRPGPT